VNFDAVLGAARDGLDRIGLALDSAFHSETAVDRTIEIADRNPPDHRVVRNAAAEVASATLMSWEAFEQWSETVLGLISPKAAAAHGLVLMPWMAPLAWMRRGISSRLDRLEARQTHPAAAAVATS
jgi:acetyl esterase